MSKEELLSDSVSCGPYYEVLGLKVYWPVMLCLKNIRLYSMQSS